MRDDRARLEDVAEAIQHIERESARGKDAFLREELVQVWVVHHLQIIGMRHILVHQYFGIDLDVVWLVVEQDLPQLKAAVNAILKSPDPGAE